MASPSNDPSPKDKSLSWLPFVGAAVIAVVALVVVLTVGSSKNRQVGLRTDADGALTCPPTYTFTKVIGGRTPRGWVPVVPSGVDGTDHLVPDAKAQHVTICRYPAAGASLTVTSTIRLGGSKIVKTNARGMTKSLSEVHKAKDPTAGACTGPDTTYLIGLVFETGVEWVSLPGTGCQRVTNGVYDTTADLTPRVATAFASGAWG